MIRYLLFVGAALAGVLIGGVNPAIILSKLIYGEDIRTKGSKNPGFTNFKRVYGMKYAVWVLIFDLLKSALPSLCFGLAFRALFGWWQLGVMYTCFFAMLGHAYPVWYHFKGGKGFLVCLSGMWLVDWRVGLVATALLTLLLFLTKYMSLSTMLAMVSCPVTLIIVGRESWYSFGFMAACVLFMIWRHKANIKRLFRGTESKFRFGSSKK